MQFTETVLTGLVWLAVLAVFFYNRHQVTRAGYNEKDSSQKHDSHG